MGGDDDEEDEEEGREGKRRRKGKRRRRGDDRREFVQGLIAAPRNWTASPPGRRWHVWLLLAGRAREWGGGLLVLVGLEGGLLGSVPSERGQPHVLQ